jgi:hypothetical protein
MNIHHGLCCTSAHHPWQGPTWESQGILLSAGRQDQLLEVEQLAPAIALQGQLVALEQAPTSRIQQHANAQLLGLFQEFLTDPESPHSSPMSFRTKELVELLEELAPRAQVLVHDRDLRARLPGLKGCHQTCRSGTYDGNLGADL